MEKDGGYRSDGCLDIKLNGVNFFNIQGYNVVHFYAHVTFKPKIEREYLEDLDLEGIINLNAS